MLTADTYDDLSLKNQILQKATATYVRSLTVFFGAFVTVSDVWTLVDGSNFSNSFATQPALV